MTAERMDDNGHGSPVHRFPDPDYTSPWKGAAWPTRLPGEDIAAWLDVVKRMDVSRARERTGGGGEA